jgi:hypothetical protein
MSFWKKVFGKNNQEVIEENLVAEDQVDETQLVTDSINSTVDETSELAKDVIAESTVTEEVAVESIVQDESQVSQAESASPEAVEDESKALDPEISKSQSEDATKDSNVLEADAQSEAQAAEELLKKELESAETAALNAQLEIEKEEFLEDLSVLDGRILPQLKVPD